MPTMEEEQNYIRYGNAENEPEGLRDFIVPEEEEDDECTIQYRKEMEEGCPEGYTTIWNSYGFSYEKMEEQKQCVYDVNGKPIQTIKDFKKEFGELLEEE